MKMGLVHHELAESFNTFHKQMSPLMYVLVIWAAFALSKVIK